MILREVIQRLIRELEESSITTLVPIHSPSDKGQGKDSEDEESTARERLPKDFA